MPKRFNLVGLETKKTKQIIIARYRENIQWVKTISNIPYIIYEKYNKKSPHLLPNIPTFPLERFDGVKHMKTPTGRESHTYLYHIIKHYDCLADMNIFLQGSPVEVNSDARDALKVLLNRDFEGIDFLPLNFPIIFCNKTGAPLHLGLPLERIFKRLFINPCPDMFAYAWGAMFCVSKEYIRKRPLAFYEEMMQIVYDEPLAGYVYERLWPTILACHDFIPHETFPKRDRDSWGMPSFSLEEEKQ